MLGVRHPASVPLEAVTGSLSGAIGANDFLRQANEYGHTDGEHASSRTDPDNAERLTGIYGS